jgi:hypothetical protein
MTEITGIYNPEIAKHYCKADGNEACADPFGILIGQD